MEKEIFSPMAIDALGEMMNISLGSSATAVSNMLDHRVDITTPTVSVVEVKSFSLGNLEPAIGVEIKYVEGLEGSNIMLLKRSDIRAIVDILMGMETPDEEFELNELTISAVCEVMNQMMGSAATSLSTMLGKMIDISPPDASLIDLNDFESGEDIATFLKGTFVKISFRMQIGDLVDSTVMQIYPLDFAKGLYDAFMNNQLGLNEPEPEPAPAPAPTPAPAPAPAASGTEVTEAQADALASFSLRLFDALEAESGPNAAEGRLASPLSVEYALAMTTNGAEGQTRAQMEATLGMPVDQLN